MAENDPHRGYYDNTTENLRRRIESLEYQESAKKLIHSLVAVTWGNGSIRQPNKEEGIQTAELCYQDIDGEDPIDRVEITIPVAGNHIDDKGELQAVVELSQILQGSEDNDLTEPFIELSKRYVVFLEDGKYKVESQFYYFYDSGAAGETDDEADTFHESQPIGDGAATTEDIDTLIKIISNAK